MSDRHIKPRTVEITEFAFDKIMSWATALDEIVFLAVCKSNKITDAVRLLNTSNARRNNFSYSKKEEKTQRQKIYSMGLQAVLGHSHGNMNHLRKPSKMDWVYLPKNSLQIIAFPIERKIGMWKFKSSYEETLKSSCAVTIVSI